MNSSFMITLFIAGTTLLIVLLAFMIGYLIVQKNKQNAYVRRVLEARVDEHEKTLNEVSKELHDNVGQLLSFSLMNLEFIGNFAVEQQQQAIQNASKFLNEALVDVRHISHSLSSELIKVKGLIGTIKDELDYLKTSKGLDSSIAIEGKYRPMLPEVELAVFRIAQEAITNTLKHANATAFSVRIEITTANFLVSFTDNGNSFNAEEIETRKGIGLINMKERAKVINGHLEITSTPSNGCSIKLSLPAPQPLMRASSQN